LTYSFAQRANGILPEKFIVSRQVSVCGEVSGAVG
jgi:hypothetical protein